MGKNIVFIILLAAISCHSSKQLISDSFYNDTWVLEEIQGYSNEAFNEMYSEKKPQITFDKATKKVLGTNSCNGYSADYTLDGKSISFGEPGPTTMMYCGEGEGVFLKMMKKVNKIHLDKEGYMDLLLDDKVLMRFTGK